MAERSLRIAILGTRGIPARYGGFETFAEELSTRLVVRGHQVTVYGRRAFGARSDTLSEYRGVKIRVTPTVMHKYLETVLHALTSFFDLFLRSYDVVLLCNAANSPFAFLVRMRGVPLAINVDGVERNRTKWNALGRVWYRLGERCSVWFASRVVADAQVIAQYYLEQYHCQSEVIPYGASPELITPGETLRHFGLLPGKYLLYVSRLEPENNALGVVQAYESQNITMPLVIVGDAPYAKEYIAQVKAAASSRIIFTGYQFGLAYKELRSHCYLYIQATEVGGTHPALVEAMAYGNCVVANDVPEHREVVDQCGVYYPKNDFLALGRELTRLIEEPQLVHVLGQKAAARAREHYSWEMVTDRYQALFCSLVNKRE